MCFKNNQECKIKSEIVNVNSDEPTFYCYSVKKSKSSSSYININNSHAKLCVPDVVKNMNLKVFSLRSRTNETRYIKFHKTCKHKCRLNASACNNKQRRTENKCRYDAKN